MTTLTITDAKKIAKDIVKNINRNFYEWAECSKKGGRQMNTLDQQAIIKNWLVKVYKEVIKEEVPHSLKNCTLAFSVDKGNLSSLLFMPRWSNDEIVRVINQELRTFNFDYHRHTIVSQIDLSSIENVKFS